MTFWMFCGIWLVIALAVAGFCAWRFLRRDYYGDNPLVIIRPKHIVYDPTPKKEDPE
jgi:hypothetical protein